jgi:hypothetical protein
MDREPTPQGNVLDRLIVELGLSEGAPSRAEDVPAVNFLAHLSEADLVARQDRILRRSMEWIGFLENQAEQLSGAAEWLYEQLAAGDTPAVIEFVRLQGDSRTAVIDRLEWTLAAFEYWVEERRPAVAGARLWIRWLDDDGLAVWRSGTEDLTEPASVRGVVQDGAEVEGEFSSTAAEQIARLVVTGLRSGELRLLRLRLLDAETSREGSVFELVPRGEAYTAAIAMADDSAGVLPPELEARLSHGESRSLAAILDDASYASATASVSASRAPSLEADLTEGINRIAVSCDIEHRAVVQCLLSLANQRLAAAISSGNHDAALRLGRAVTALAAFALQAPRT